MRLRGLPYTAKEEEIIDFFKGIKVGPPPPLSKTVLRKWSLSCGALGIADTSRTLNPTSSTLKPILL